LNEIEVAGGGRGEQGGHRGKQVPRSNARVKPCYRRWVRIFLVAALALAGCSDGSAGAVSVRWRIVDLSNGSNYDPKAFGAADGSCMCGGSGASCPGEPDWRVQRVRLKLVDEATGAPPAVDPALLDFACDVREATTPFRVPAGRYALSLEAFNYFSPDAPAGVTPAPLERTIKDAEIVNLDVIEIGVNP
jgi:hypothetical protein